MDGTADPAHGEQEGVAYHGYYRQHMYHPLLVCDGDTAQLITAVLRPGNVHGSRFLVLVLRRLVHPPQAGGRRGPPSRLRRARRQWLRHPARLRRVVRNPRRHLHARASPQSPAGDAGRPAAGRSAGPPEAGAQEGAKVRLAGEASYQAGSWPQPRRVRLRRKAEVLAKGPNTRFVVTTRPDPPLALYDWYVDRGEPENWIKDFKNALAADRLSDHRFWANQFRLVLHAAAYWLLDTLPA